MVKTVLPYLCLLLCWSCQQAQKPKINGVSFVASGEAAAQAHMDELLALHANHAAVMPFGFIRDPESTQIIFNSDRQWFGETKAGAKQYIEMLHANNIEVMLKPQLWIRRGTFTGSMRMDSEADWKALERSYTDFILTYAELAQETGVAIYCIGTELERFTQERPHFWKELIAQIKMVYKGKLTYASNWDEYARVPFWDALDYIGVDAYFPLSDDHTPSVAELKTKWEPIKRGMESLSDSLASPILFTEYGYRSMDHTAKKPWATERNEGGVNLTGQRNATQALIEAFWEEDWFAGGYVWKWFMKHQEVGGHTDNRFTPQNKPAQDVLREYYQKN